MNYKNSIRSILWVALVAIIAWLFLLDRVPSGLLTLTQNFKTPTVYFDDFRPGERLQAFQHEGDRVFHRIIASPIYFHLRTPREFSTVTFDIEYRNATSTLMSSQRTLGSSFDFGGQTGPLLSDFSYESIVATPDNAWHTAHATFDLSKLHYHPTEHRYQFSFQTTAPLDVARITAHFSDH